MDASRYLKETVEERERTAHFVAASLTFSVFCSEKPEQVIETQLIYDGVGEFECRNL